MPRKIDKFEACRKLSAELSNITIGELIRASENPDDLKALTDLKKEIETNLVYIANAQKSKTKKHSLSPVISKDESNNE